MADILKLPNKLTPHQKKILAALDLLAKNPNVAAYFHCWRVGLDEADGYHLRYEIARILDNFSIHLTAMKKLWQLGFVEPESEFNVNHVERGYCRCCSDRWRISPAGAALVSKWNVVLLQPERIKELNDLVVKRRKLQQQKDEE